MDCYFCIRTHLSGDCCDRVFTAQCFSVTSPFFPTILFNSWHVWKGGPQTFFNNQRWILGCIKNVEPWSRLSPDCCRMIFFLLYIYISKMTTCKPRAGDSGKGESLSLGTFSAEAESDRERERGRQKSEMATRQIQSHLLVQATSHIYLPRCPWDAEKSDYFKHEAGLEVMELQIK